MVYFNQDKGKEIKTMKEKYLELKTMANRVEQLRLELWQNKEHRELQDNNSNYIDDKLFHIQSELRNIYEFCMLEVID